MDTASRTDTGRTPQACDECRRSKTKCSGTKPQCRRCLRRRTPCTWSRPHDLPETQSQVPGMLKSPGPSAATTPAPRMVADSARRTDVSGTGPAAASVPPQRLLDIFLARHHDVEFCSFLHKSTTSMVTLQQQAPFLAAAIASLAALYLTPEDVALLQGTALGSSASAADLSDHYAQRANTFARSLSDRPSIHTIQAFLVLAVRNLIVWKDFKAWMHAGSAIRMAQALQLGAELGSEQIVPSGNSRLGPRQREMRRRTFWACFVVDRLISYTCHHRFAIDLPSSVGGGGEHVRLPCSDTAFAYDETDPGPWLNELMRQTETQTQTQTEIPHNHHHHQQLSRMGVAPFYVAMVRLWGDMALLHATGGRRRTPHAPTDQASAFAQTSRAISDFSIHVVPPVLHWSTENYRRHRMTGQAQAFVQFNFLLHHARCVMHHEYLPQLDMQYYTANPLDAFGPLNHDGSTTTTTTTHQPTATAAAAATTVGGVDAAGLPPDYVNVELIETCMDAIDIITEMATELYNGGSSSRNTSDADRDREILQSTVAANALMTAAAVHLWFLCTQTCDKVPKHITRAKFMLLLQIIQSWEPRWPVAAAWGETLSLLYKLYEYSYGTEPVPEFVSWEAEASSSTSPVAASAAASDASGGDNSSGFGDDGPGLSYGDVLSDPAAVGQCLHDKVRSILAHPLHAPEVKRKNLRMFSQTLWQQHLWLKGLLGGIGAGGGSGGGFVDADSIVT